MKTEIINGKLVITLDMTAPEISKTGKSLMVAGTGGFKKTGVKVDGKEISISVNAILPIK